MSTAFEGRSQFGRWTVRDMIKIGGFVLYTSHGVSTSLDKSSSFFLFLFFLFFLFFKILKNIYNSEKGRAHFFHSGTHGGGLKPPKVEYDM